MYWNPLATGEILSPTLYRNASRTEEALRCTVSHPKQSLVQILRNEVEMMKTTIHCLIPERDTLRFYMTVNGESYYLFDQNFRHGVYSFYKNGVYLDQALDTTLANFDFAILNTMEKLPAYIK